MTIFFASFHQLFLGLLGGEAGDGLQLFLHLSVGGFELAFLAFEQGELPVEVFAHGFVFVGLALELAVALVELQLALLQFAFGGLQLGVALLHLLLVLGFEGDEAFLGLDHFLLLEQFEFLLALFLRFLLVDFEHGVAPAGSCQQGCDAHYDCQYHEVCFKRG